MANSNDILFTIDAGKILATLHLAAVTQAPNYKPIYNTGIKDCTESDTPENPGKATFDFSNKKMNEIGFFREDTYPEVISLKNNILLKKEEEQLNKLVKSQGLTDTDDKVKAQKEKIVKLKQSLTGVKESEYEKIDSEIEKINEERKKRKQEVLAKLKKRAFKDIKQYLTTFSGKEHASKFKEDEILVSLLDKMPKSLKDVEVKNYKIQDSGNNKKIKQDLDKKLNEQIDNAKKLSDFDNFSGVFCYKIGYQFETLRI